MLLRVITGILLLFIGVDLPAQFAVKYNDAEIEYPAAGINYSFLHSTNFTDSTLRNIQPNTWKGLTGAAIPISFADYTTWIKIPLGSIIKYGEFDYVNIDDPHINFLKCWIVKHDSIIKSFTLTGDNELYKTRQLATTSFVFPINSRLYKDCNIVIAADKRFTKLDLPIVFCTSSYFVHQNTNKDLLFGIIIGFCFLLLLFNCYLFITLKKRFYVWYCLYLFLVIIYLFANGGFLFKYVTPNYPQFNDVVRPLALTLFEVPLLLFFIDLIDIKSRSPKLFIFIKRLVLFYMVVFLIAVAFLNFGGFEIQGILLKVMGLMVPSYLLFSLFTSLYFVVKRVQFSVFAFLSFLLFTLFILVYSFQQSEFIASTPFTKYSNYWAIFCETVIATSLLAWQYKFYSDRAIQLQQQNLEMQQEIFNETAAWQEKEMQRMSSLLHDTVGANLGFLRLETDNMALTEEGRNKIGTLITRIGNEVRNMSHSFSPIVLQDKGLYNALDDMAKLIRNNSLINVQVEWIGEKQKISFQYQIIIYRIIQELMQNMLKHSKANNAFLQIMIEKNLVSIYVEDDGIGISTNNLNTGVGLKSIENLVKVLKGSFRIESKKHDGFSISIEFNQLNNEKI
jgi:signal transduction histidine kinase